MPSSPDPRGSRTAQRAPSARHGGGPRYAALPRRRLTGRLGAAALTVGLAGGLGLGQAAVANASPATTLAGIAYPLLSERVAQVGAEARARLEATLTEARATLEVSDEVVTRAPEARELLASAIAEAEALVASDTAHEPADAVAAPSQTLPPPVDPAAQAALPAEGALEASGELGASEPGAEPVPSGDADPAASAAATPEASPEATPPSGATAGTGAAASTPPESAPLPAGRAGGPSAADLAEASAAVASAERQMAVTALVAAQGPANEQLALWEPIAADPARLDDLRAALAAADSLLPRAQAAPDGSTPEAAEGGEAAALESAGAAETTAPTPDIVRAATELREATEALPRVEIAPDGSTLIDGILVVNKTIALPSGYDPGLLPETQQAFEAMRSAAAADGITLFIKSGYRSYADQRIVYGDYAARLGQAVADTFSSRPGHSEHQSGLTIDVNLARAAFAGTPEARWIAEHAPDFGFVVRYPEGREDVTGYTYEPWHLRYLGQDLATQLTAADLSLEEYLGISSTYPR